MEKEVDEKPIPEGEKPAPKHIPVFGVKDRIIEDEMKTSYLDYAMSVIVSRALPDVRDGLKPVHRRVLYAMHEMGMLHNKPYKKSARIVGEVLGKYHPHGDSAVYFTLVRMAQSFSLRYMLVDGQGNFGSIDGDNPAAMRYTEARLKKIAEEMLIDIDKDTVDFKPNFSDEFNEPIVLPAKLPNLLINGTSGIAVGMATNIPPHNITEISTGMIHLIDNPDATLKDMMEFVKGPDFPTGGYIMGDGGIRSAYATGRGKVCVRSKAHVEEGKKKDKIIVTEVPYMVNKSQLLEQIASLVKDGIVDGISDLRDESDREGIRIVIELKKDVNSEVVLNQLYKHSRLQVTFGINNLALVNNQPKTLSLLETMHHFIAHRQEVVRRRTQFDLNKAEEKAHILEGLAIALDNIDKIIALIKKSSSVELARTGLMQSYKLSEKQAQAILEMKLQKLTSLEQDKIKDDLKTTMALILKLKEILGDEKLILSIIKEETTELLSKYKDERRTEILPGEYDDIEIADMIDEHTVVITKSHKGYVKRLPVDTYKQQKRGGKGIIAATTTDEDFLEDMFIVNSHSYLLFFSDKGKVYWKKAYEIPESSRTAKGKPIVNLLSIDPTDKITAMIPVREFDDQHFLFMATRNGVVKKTNLSLFSRQRAGGIIAINLDDGDKLIGALMTDGKSNLLLSSKKGLSIRFDERDVRPIGRASRGVKGINLKKSDQVIGLATCDDGKTVLTITENGYGKRTSAEEYRMIGRGGVGVINIISNERNGSVVDVKVVNDDDEIMFISKKGIAMRTYVHDISVIGRNTQGMRLMRLGSGDCVASAACIINEDSEKVLEGSPASMPVVSKVTSPAVDAEDIAAEIEEAEPDSIDDNER